MWRTFFVSLLLVCAASSVPAQALAPGEVRTLLEQIRQRRASAPNVQADFREEKTLRLMNKPIVSAGKVWFQSPNKFRREVRGNSPSITVSDGEQLWIYYPNFKSVERYTLGKHSPVDAVIAAINAAMNLENVETSFRILGRKIDNAHELELTPRSPSMKRMFQTFTVRLNPDLLAERTEMIQPNGDHIVTVYSNQSRAAIDRATFEFKPPAGAEVTTPLGR